MKTTMKDKQEAISSLRELIPAGSTVYTVLRNMSRSGMQRMIDLYVMTIRHVPDCARRNGGNHPTEGVSCDCKVSAEPRRITYQVAEVTSFTYDWKYEALKVSGCGMDVGFEVVYHLGRVLWPEFTCIGEGCPANDHSNERERNYTVGRKHSDGGYSLKQRWM